MTRLEERLRSDLPALADAMIGEGTRLAVDEDGDLVVIDRSETVKGRMSRRAVLVAAVAAAASGGVAFGTDLFRAKETQVEAAGSSAPDSFGSWSPMANAPIEPRPHAVAAWTGSKAAFWAGSNLSRGFAYTDGALYDPSTDSWEPMAVPGWGHPGLTSAFFDGELYAIAKGGGTRFDPVAGEWRDLPPVDGMSLTAIVATDDGVWGLGPADTNPTGRNDLAIARYLPRSDTWLDGPTREGTDAQASLIAGLSRLESAALWTGTEIALCNPTGECIGFDPDRETWRSIPPVPGAEGRALGVATDLGLVMVVQAEEENSPVAIHVLTAEGWQRRAAGVPIDRFDTVTAAGAGEWMAMFGVGQPPTLVHLPSGSWHVAADAPIGAVEAPNVVWTGEHVIVWGGASDEESVAGAVWTPPDPWLSEDQAGVAGDK